jgi:hypothetical protein
VVVMKGVLRIVSAGRVNWRGFSPGAGEEEETSSSSSRARFLRPRLLGPLFAADMLSRSGELGGSVSGGFVIVDLGVSAYLILLCVQDIGCSNLD